MVASSATAASFIVAGVAPALSLPRPLCASGARTACCSSTPPPLRLSAALSVTPPMAIPLANEVSLSVSLCLSLSLCQQSLLPVSPKGASTVWACHAEHAPHALKHQKGGSCAVCVFTLLIER